LSLKTFFVLVRIAVCLYVFISFLLELEKKEFCKELKGDYDAGVKGLKEFMLFEGFFL